MPMSWGILQQGCSVTNLQGTLSWAHIAWENWPDPAPGLVLVSDLLSSSISLSASESCRRVVAGVEGVAVVVVLGGLVVSRIRKINIIAYNSTAAKKMKRKIEFRLLKDAKWLALFTRKGLHLWLWNSPWSILLFFMNHALWEAI